MKTRYRYNLFLKILSQGLRYICNYKLLFEKPDRIIIEHIASLPQTYLNPSEKRYTRKIGLGKKIILGRHNIRTDEYA